MPTPILLDAASSFAADTLEDCSAGFVLIFVAIGVFLIVISSMRMGGYRTLLHLNNQNTIGGNYVPEQQDRQQYHNSTLAAKLDAASKRIGGTTLKMHSMIPMVSRSACVFL